MVFLPDLPRNRTLLITGLVLLVLAVCCLAGALFGWDTHGTGARIGFGILGAFLLLAGIGVLFLQKAPQNAPLAMSTQGVLIPVGGSTASLGWASVSRVRLERAAGGSQLVVELRPGAPVPPQLQDVLHQPGGAVAARLVVGLGGASPDAVAARLQSVAPPGIVEVRS